MSSPRLFLDVGLVAVEPTGIPRATRNLALALKEFAPSLGVDVQWCVAGPSGRYVAVSELTPPRMLPPSVADDTWLERVLDVVRRLPMPFPFAWRDAVSRALGRAQRPHVFWQLADAPPITPSPRGRDILLLPHAGYSRLPKKAIQNLLQEGVKVSGICHDILPLTKPTMFSRGDRISFQSSLFFTIKVSSSIIVVSDFIRRQVIAWFHDRGWSVPTVEVVRPVILLPPPQVTPRPEIVAMERRPTILMVGTFVARKNHLTLLKAASALWEDGLDFDLLFIGQATPLGREILRALRSHPEFGNRLFLLHDATDADVADAYRRARVVAMPSEAEGFGLPVAEAEVAGCAVVCSDLEVFREFASDGVRFVPSRDVAAWKTALAPFVVEPTHRSREATETATAWNKDQVVRLSQALFPELMTAP